MTDTKKDRSIDPQARLLGSLYPVAKRIREMKCRQLRVAALLRALCICATIAMAAFFVPAFADYALISAFVTASALLIHAATRERKITLDYIAAARSVEAENQELKQVLVTATAQQLTGESDFFADRVVNQALASPSRPHWHRAGRKAAYRSFASYFAALSAVALCLLLSYLASNWDSAAKTKESRARLVDSKLYVEPGDLEIERGTSLLVTARFDGELPEDVTLELLDSDGSSQRLPMARSLSDPIFAHALSEVEQPLQYRILYGNLESETYRISTYELPELLQADASLDFPDYTGWDDRSIEDTLRISAIEGTQLSYAFNTNKRIATAYLQGKDGQRIDLSTANDTDLQLRLDTTIVKSATYTLHLQDEAGRSNVYPPDIRVEAIPNKRPNLRLQTPKGDQRLSALEEVLFTGTATDDFGLQDFGIGFAFAAGARDERSLAQPAFERGSLSENVSYLLTLEDKSLQAKDTLSWYLWATDFGPDGELRRTTGDLYFASIRAFDEIFREQDQGGGQGQGQASGQGLELLEKQRRIAISLFRIKNAATDAEAAIEDIDVVQRSQVEALNELHQLIIQLKEPSAIQHAAEAQRFMEGVDVGLINAVDLPSLAPLELAWSDAQGAYDKLVKLSEDEFNVSRSQNQTQGGGGGTSRSQAQINELDFRQEDSRYETASEAQSLASPEDRQNLELIGKLNELSRRQDDLNERLQEMQSDLANAKTEEERQRIQRELKRLEEEQRAMVADADAAIQQAGNRQGSQQARQQLEEARENMREASEQMQEGQVSQALASGTRAQDTLEKTREQMREANSSQFSEAMREARSRAKELAERQNQLERELSEFRNQAQRELDDGEEREALAQSIETQADALDAFLDQVRTVAESSENVEPGLFRELYQVLRDSNGSRFEERYETSAQYLRQGFLDEASERQEGLSRDLEKLDEAISQAAEGILGSEGATLQFAQSEIDSLRQQLENERPSGEAEDSQRAGAAAGGSAADRVRNALAGFGGTPRGPLTGEDFGEWIDRLSTVESLIEEPSTRTRIAEARETAEEMRRDFKRRSELPQWEMIVNEVVAPLNEVSSWLSSELSRIENPDSLQALDSDPVPDEYQEIVQRYYESLGDD